MSALTCYADRATKLNPHRKERDWLPSLIAGTVVAILLTATHFAVKVNEQKAEIAELYQQIEQAKLTKKQQCWTVGGGGEPVVTLCATPWRGV